MDMERMRPKDIQSTCNLDNFLYNSNLYFCQLCLFHTNIYPDLIFSVHATIEHPSKQWSM